MTNQNETFTITVNGAIDIVNVLTYEYYARVIRRLHAAGFKCRASFEQYLEECDKYLDMDMLPRDAWECGYELIADLFDENETNGTPCDEEAKFNLHIMQALDMFNKRK